MDIVSICVLVAFAIVAIGLIVYNIKKSGIRQFAINLISQAETMSKSNEEKMNYCIDQFIKIIPAPISLFINRDMVKMFIQKIFDQVKVALDATKPTVENK